MAEMLWQPSPDRVADANITRFAAMVRERHGLNAVDYAALHRWSIENRAAFWSALWDYAEIIGDRGDGPVLVDGDRMPGAKWFPGARLNFAENLLRRRDDAPAILFRGEDRVRYALSFRRLRDAVSMVAQGLRAAGVGKGDRVAGYMPNMPETVVAMLATTSIGATWSSRLAGFRRAGGRGSIRPDRAESAVQRRRLLLRRKAVRFRRPARAGVRPDSVDRAHRRRAVHHECARSLRGRECRDAGRIRHRPRPRGDRVRTPPLRPPALHHVLVGHHRRPEVHRARRRRHAGAARQGAGAAQRREARGAAPLLHDLRLDDVELAGERAGLRGDHRALRRLSVPSRRQRAVRLRGGGGHRDLRHLRQVHRRSQESGPRPGTDPRSLEAEGNPLHRLATGSRELRLRLRVHQARRLPLLHQRRHRHHLLLRGRQPHRAGPSRRDPVPGARARRARIRRRRAQRRRREGRARVHPRLSFDARRLLERSRRAQVPRRLLRPVRQCLVSRRLRRDHRARRG